MRVVLAVLRGSLLHERRRPWLKRQTAWHVGADVQRERRAADFETALDELVEFRRAWNFPARLPDAREVGLAVGQPRRWRGQIGFAIGRSRNIRRRIDAATARTRQRFRRQAPSPAQRSIGGLSPRIPLALRDHVALLGSALRIRMIENCRLDAMTASRSGHRLGKHSQLNSSPPQLGDCVTDYLDACRHYGFRADKVAGAFIEALECLVWQGVAIQATLL